MGRVRVLIPLLLLAGCTVGPDYVPPEVDSPATWRVEYDAAQDIANTAWWTQFDDPVLTQLVDEALVSNKDVRIAAARIDEFAARLGITDSEALPQIGYGGGAAREQSSRELPGGLPPGVDRTNAIFDATLNVGWELDVWGRIRRASEAARAELLAADEGRRTVILTLVSAVATSYIELLALDKQLEVAVSTREARRESLRLFEVQRDGGVASDLQVAQIRSEFEQAAVRVPVIEQQIALLENSISVLLGRNPGPIARGGSFDDLALPEIPAGVPSELLTRRPDLLAAEQRLIAANVRIGVARAEFYPRISLTGLLGFASDDLSDLARSSANVWSIAADFVGPIFTGGFLTGQLEAAEAIQEQTLVSYLLDIQTAFREVEDALVSGQKTREQLEIQKRQVEALVEYARLARVQYDNGYVSFIEVKDAERLLFDAELVEVQVQNDVYAALIDTYKAMGGGWVLEAEDVADGRLASTPPPTPTIPIPFRPGMMRR